MANMESPAGLKQLHALYRTRKASIQKRLAEFAKVPESEYFYELCFCLLTPQSNAHKCWEAVTSLKMDDFQNKDFHPSAYLHRRTRFHNHKGEYLLEWKKSHKRLLEELKAKKNSAEIRGHLVKNVKGMWYKEASHFLRNVGHRNLAILDRHILKNLRHYGAIGKMPKAMTRKEYFAIEKKFLEFAEKVKIPMDELDLLFWSMQTRNIFK